MSGSPTPQQDAPPAKSREIEPGFSFYTTLWALWAVGIGITLFLLWSTRGDGLPPGCGVAQGCGIVLQSEYSRIFGFSLTTWSLGYYVVAALVLLMARFSFQISLAPPLSLLLPVTAAVAAGAGVWSMIVMGVILQEFCYYCVTLHVCNFVFFGISIVYATQDWHHRQYRRWKANVPPLPKAPVVFHVVLAVLLIAGQSVVMSLFHSDAPATLGAVGPESVLGVKEMNNIIETIKVDAVPAGGNVIWTSKGPRDAPNTIVTWSCLTCTHCKRANNVFKALMERYPGQLRVDMRFFPLWKCNDMMKGANFTDDHRHACRFARYAWAVAHASPEKFEEFVNWVYENQEELERADAIRKAEELIGVAEFKAALESDAVSLREQQDLAHAKKLHLTGVPHVFMVGGQVYGGMSFNSLEKLFTEQFGWEPSDAEVELAAEDREFVLVGGREVKKIAQQAKHAETLRDFKKADALYQQVLKHQPTAWGIMLNRAWLLATCDEDEIFNPVEAQKTLQPVRALVEDRERELKEYKPKSSIEKKAVEQNLEKMKDVWAQFYEVDGAVHAANGRFKKARDATMDGIRVLGTKDDAASKKSAQRLEKRFDDFYAKNRVFRRND